MEEAGRAPASSVLASPKARLHAVGCAAVKAPPRIAHSVDVEAEFLYEASALALSRLYGL